MLYFYFCRSVEAMIEGKNCGTDRIELYTEDYVKDTQR